MIRLSDDELARLEAIRRYDILDTPPDGSFDRITALAARLFDVPIALVTIVDEDRIWFKSRFGLDGVREISRDPGLCASAIYSDETYVVAAARTDPRTLSNPLVAGEFGLQFYAAAPLVTLDGYRLGTLCLLDRNPREMSAQDMDTLATLGGIVMDELELRLKAMGTVALERSLRTEATRLAKENERLYRRADRVATTLQDAMLPQSFPVVPHVTFDALYVPATNESEVGGDWYDAFLIGSTQLVLSIGDVAGHGLRAAALMGKLRQSLRAIALSESSPLELLRLLDSILRSEESETIATSFVAAYDLESKILQYANAGHPPPLLRLPNGTIVELSPTGAPLGLRAAHEPAGEPRALEPGSSLLFYTDGLTEATRDILVGEKRLRAALGDATIAASASPASAIYDAVLIEGSSDDIAIMSVSFH